MDDMPKLRCFVPMTESQVLKAIIKTESCEVDAIPTTIFKNLLPKLAPLITKIIKLSLTQGEFCKDWKIAIVRPLLKR